MKQISIFNCTRTVKNKIFSINTLMMNKNMQRSVGGGGGDIQHQIDTQLLNFEDGKEIRDVEMVITNNGDGENNIFELISRFYKVLYPDRVKVVSEYMPTGDIAFRDKKTGKFVGPLIERKTNNDMALSFYGERTEQIGQMHEVSKNHKMYILERNPNSIHSKNSLKGLYTHLVSLPSKYGCDLVIHSLDELKVSKERSKLMTAYTVMNLHHRLDRMDEEHFVKLDLDNHSVVNSFKNKAQIREQNKLPLILNMINRISVEMGNSVANVYPTLADLMKAYQEYISKGLNSADMLVNIPHKTEKSNILGKSASEAISKYLEVDSIFSGSQSTTTTTPTKFKPQPQYIPPPQLQNTKTKQRNSTIKLHAFKSKSGREIVKKIEKSLTYNDDDEINDFIASVDMSKFENKK